MQTYWSLYNNVEKLRIDDLKPEQVRLILLSIPTVRMKDWFACRQGEVHWQPLMDIPEFYEDVRALRGNLDDLKASPQIPSPPVVNAAPVAPPAPARPKHRPMFEEAPSQIETLSTLEVHPSDLSERRSARRYQRRLLFRVIQGGKQFETETVDVSMSGLSLTDPIPAWAPKTFPAEVSLNGQNLSVVVGRVSAAEHNKLKLLDADSWDVLRTWIVNW